MIEVAIHGGTTSIIFGPPQDAFAYFECVYLYAIPRYPELDGGQIADRLYRHYVAIEDIPKAEAELELIADAFSEVEAVSVDWDRFGLPIPESRLDTHSGTLKDVFRRFPLCFEGAAEHAVVMMEDYKDDAFRPVRVIVTNEPWFGIARHQRSLADYDAREGMPFWLEDAHAAKRYLTEQKASGEAKGPKRR